MLRIYKSEFGCGYILRGVEPPPKLVAATVVREPVEEPESEDEPAEPERSPRVLVKQVGINRCRPVCRNGKMKIGDKELSSLTQLIGSLSLVVAHISPTQGQYVCVPETGVSNWHEAGGLPVGQRRQVCQSLDTGC